jgi:hypothetical protein
MKHQEIVGSVKMWPTMTGGHVIEVANFTISTVSCCESHASVHVFSARRVTFMNFTFLIVVKADCCSQRQLLPNADNVKETRFLISCTYFSSHR